MVPKLRLTAAPMLAVTLVLALAGCVSLGKEPPETLFNLTPARIAAAGSGGSGTVREAISVREPEASARLDVLRVPVQVADASVAYLQNAQWVEKPARLFTRLLEETIRANSNRLVVDGSDAEFAAATKLSGQLLEMGYDVASGSVVVRYNAVLTLPDGQIRTRRFESSVSGIPASAPAVAPALNQAANQVAADVATWVG
jgi:cholesterol transport system auxiliary component